MSKQLNSLATIIAKELMLKSSQVEVVIQLFEDKATVPFIARYRKEETGHLSETQLWQIEDRLHYLQQLNERRSVILNSIKEQEKLTPALEKQILEAASKTELEDLYLPYRPKRHTKAQLAREAGLELLARGLLDDNTRDPLQEAASYINPEKNILDATAALEGARHILMDIFSEDAKLLSTIRNYLWENGQLISKVSNPKNTAAQKFSDYFDYVEAIKKIPSHRALALFRGRRENCLQLALTLANQEFGEQTIAQHFNISQQQLPAQAWLFETIRMTWKSKLFTKLELELLTRLRETAEEEAIRVFARNLRDLLLAAPAGKCITMGLDPGIRTGIKVAIVDATGKVLDHTTVFPFAPQNEWHAAIAELAKLASRYQVDLISVGNGTGSRETERLIGDLIKMYPDLNLSKMVVSEAGASVYSASPIAVQEFPDLDITIRSAVSIARRLQDPLAELVKIDPKAIGVGQYQHDVNQTLLARSLGRVVEDCVNLVGVDINTASSALLTYVSGLNESLAKNIVAYREEHGAFESREQLKAIPRMGDKSFEQSAGFLRLQNGINPLDASAVHPEAYPLVEKILSAEKMDLAQIIGNFERLKAVNADAYVDATFNLTTIQDVLKELEKPGRDPRPTFKTVKFKEGVEEIKHLEIGMLLEGVVSNVTNFGAFVDVGVHQDGLVHISEMTHQFTADPHKIVKAGDIIQVKVIEVDIERRRVGLSMKLQEEKKSIPVKKAAFSPKKKAPASKPKLAIPLKPKQPARVFNTAMADALAKLKKDRE